MSELTQKLCNYVLWLQDSEKESENFFIVAYDLNFVEKERSLKHDEEYQYLMETSQKSFKTESSCECNWLSGFPLAIRPVETEEHFFYIDFALANGGFVSHPFAIQKGMNDNYLHLLRVLEIEEELGFCNETIIGKPFMLQIKEELVGKEWRYTLCDIEK